MKRFAGLIKESSEEGVRPDRNCVFGVWPTAGTITSAESFVPFCSSIEVESGLSPVAGRFTRDPSTSLRRSVSPDLSTGFKRLT